MWSSLVSRAVLFSVNKMCVFRFHFWMFCHPLHAAMECIVDLHCFQVCSLQHCGGFHPLQHQLLPEKFGNGATPSSCSMPGSLLAKGSGYFNFSLLLNQRFSFSSDTIQVSQVLVQDWSLLPGSSHMTKLVSRAGSQLFFYKLNCHLPITHVMWPPPHQVSCVKFFCLLQVSFFKPVWGE